MLSTNFGVESTDKNVSYFIWKSLYRDNCNAAPRVDFSISHYRKDFSLAVFHRVLCSYIWFSLSSVIFHAEPSGRASEICIAIQLSLDLLHDLLWISQLLFVTAAPKWNQWRSLNLPPPGRLSLSDVCFGFLSALSGKCGNFYARLGSYGTSQ